MAKAQTAPKKAAAKAAPKLLELVKQEVVNLLKKLGFKSPEKWTDERLVTKLKELDEVTDEDTAEEKELDKKEAALLQSIVAACGTEAAITVKDGAAPAKTGKAAPSTQDPDEEDEGEGEEDEEAEEEPEGDEEEEEAEEEVKPAKKGGKPTPPPPAKTGKAAVAPRPQSGRGAVKGQKKVGIVAEIINQFAKGSAKKPVKKDQVHAVLVKKFGPGTEANKDPKGMRNTVNAAPSWMKTEKKLNVQTDGEGGFWLVGYNPEK